MEELKKAFYEVMYKYEKSFGETGVMTNLNLWAQEKAGLLELLRRHPNWDEDAKAIVFSFDEGRGMEIPSRLVYGSSSNEPVTQIRLPFLAWAFISLLASSPHAQT